MRIIGKSKPVEALKKMIERVAPTKSSVLIIGESGTGKELVARELHDLSAAKGKPFVPVNCGAIPEHLLESELFGHKKGSFTGAVGDKPGLFEAANSGTLFLDEIGELPLAMQVKLLRALQERVIRRVGSNDDIKLDVRIVAATNRNLESAVKKGTFREDLYYRLNVIMLETPPLRDRKGDVRILAEHFLQKFSKKFSKELEGIDLDALTALENHAWPGNIRELENALERAVALESGRSISVAALEGSLRGETPRAVSGFEFPDLNRGPISLAEFLARVEGELVKRALSHCSGDTSRAAQLLKTTVSRVQQVSQQSSRQGQ
jgi:two-component system, NtrC family, response regulator PilR